MLSCFLLIINSEDNIMIQVYSNNPTAILAGGDLPFTGFKSRKGCSTTLNSGGVALNTPGVYMIVANFSYEATAAGDITVTQRVNGVVSNVDLATASADAAGIVNLTIPSLVTVDRECCSCGNSAMVSYQVNAAGTLVSANATVTKIV